ncbi:hypothetical protein CI238_13270 [Colletotrichum incanum]|uniref:Uncharacterized protein n=1 Tax=Colletotrichum incanum TaxID=1573173 RepID=A0A161Y3R9_COLIC|nr:hypothetical protein CI238_13270 [Colletotrichum incanum]
MSMPTRTFPGGVSSLAVRRFAVSPGPCIRTLCRLTQPDHGHNTLSAPNQDTLQPNLHDEVRKTVELLSNRNQLRGDNLMKLRSIDEELQSIPRRVVELQAQASECEMNERALQDACRQSYSRD